MKTRAIKPRVRETVEAVHRRKADESHDALAAIASMPATGAPYALNTASVEADNTPATQAGEIGFAVQSGSPATRAAAGWSRAFAAVEKERIG